MRKFLSFCFSECLWFTMADKLARIAIVSTDKCKPRKCRQECKRSCPVVRMGKLCIEVDSSSKVATLSEELCIGCGICVKVVGWWLLLFLSHFSARNARSVPSKSSICLVNWRNRLHIVTVQTLSSCTDCQPPVLDKSLKPRSYDSPL